MTDQRLAARLERDGGDVDGWLMLARSLKVTGRHREAAAAYEKAATRAVQDPELLADWIDPTILAIEDAMNEGVYRRGPIDQPEALGLALADMLRADGADEILAGL